MHFYFIFLQPSSDKLFKKTKVANRSINLQVYEVQGKEQIQFKSYKSMYTRALTFLYISLVFLLISNLTNGLRLHQFLGTKTNEANKLLKTDANGAH